MFIVSHIDSNVAKLTYFWGGKSSAIGWDSEWGKMKLVTSEGSRSTGCMRPFGLDCSGFVTWAFHNAGFQNQLSVTVQALRLQKELVSRGVMHNREI